ncbi:MAG: HNH endonuclease [Campylobacterota bacterium]|nr:HNH endonuclease [Campylobacterota bacterium]
MKICTKCKITKELSEFHKYSKSKDGRKPSCKVCRLKEAKEYSSNNKDKISKYRKQYGIDNKEKISKYQKDRKLAIREEATKGSEIKLLSEETAIDIKGYEGLYKITTLGRVISYPDKTHYNFRVKTHDLNREYPRVTIYKDGKGKHFFVHRLIAIHFIDNSENKPHINHINAIKTDFSISNLEWCTPKENIHHAIKLGINGTNRNIKHKTNKSGLLGVHWHKRNKKWCARLGFNKTRYNLGFYDTKEEAGVAYDKAVMKHIGVDGNFNFT